MIGALGAIPVAGTIQILLEHWQRHRREREEQPAAGGPDPPVEEPPAEEAEPPARPAPSPSPQAGAVLTTVRACRTAFATSARPRR